MGLVTEARDIDCVDSLRPGIWASGVRLVGQRCYRRLITPRGMLRGGEEEEDFGLDLAGYVGSTALAVADAMLPAMIRNELLKDPAVEEVEVEATRTEVSGEVSWTVNISLKTTEGDVELIIGVSSVTVELLGVLE